MINRGIVIFSKIIWIPYYHYLPLISWVEVLKLIHTCIGCTNSLYMYIQTLVILSNSYVIPVFITENKLSHFYVSFHICHHYNMLVPWRSLNGSQNITAQCKKRENQKHQFLGVKEARAVNSRAFTTYRITLDMVPSSKYLRRVLLTADHDWMAVIQTDKGAGG